MKNVDHTFTQNAKMTTEAVFSLVNKANRPNVFKKVISNTAFRRTVFSIDLANFYSVIMIKLDSY